MVVLGILCIGFGILMLVARDFFWALTEMGNSFAGRQSERTELWEAGQMISGVVCILIGVFVICAGAAEDREREERRIAPTQTAVAVESVAATLDSVFAEFIPQWERTSESGVQTVRPASIGVYARDLTYGRCDDGRFFIAIEGYKGIYADDYLYLTEGDPVSCLNDALRFYGSSNTSTPWRRLMMTRSLRGSLGRSNPTLAALLTPTRATATAAPEATETPGATATRRARQ